MSESLYSKCKIISDEIESDFGGGSPVTKTFLMAYIIKEFKLDSYLEVGVYKGKSFFPSAYAISLNNGTSIGVDPYNMESAYENDCEETLKNEIENFIEATDFNKIYNDVSLYKSKYECFDKAMFIRKKSQIALKEFILEKKIFDFIHIDGNHDTENVKEDFYNSYELLKEGGFIVFDDINWESVKIIYEEAKQKMTEVFKNETFAVLYKKTEKEKNNDPFICEKLTLQLNSIYDRVVSLQEIEKRVPRIGVGVITYNQKDYIIECLDSLINQTGNFKYDIIVYDDASTDGTQEVIKKYIDSLSDDNQKRIIFKSNEINLGSIDNFKQLMDFLEKCNYDYITFCEGDDYLLSSKKLETHLNLHLKNPDIAVSFNHLAVKWENNSSFEIAKFNTNLHSKLTTEKLIQENFIANLGNGFYSSKIFEYIDKKIYESYVGDWLLNIIISQHGKIYYEPQLFNLYRKHDNGCWAGAQEEYKSKTLLENIYKYNSYTNYIYDKYFSKQIEMLKLQIINIDKLYIEKDLIIIDDIFPSPMSAFRYEEFNQILNSIKNTQIICTGESNLTFTKKGLEQTLIEYKRENHKNASSVSERMIETQYLGKLIYCIFLGNAYYNVLPVVEKHKIPFMFTLYPGGAFAMNSGQSDAMLKKVMSSPYFRKVIVTQSVIYEYLIEKNFCDLNKIEFIYGGITSNKLLGFNIENKLYFGETKKQLDICFVAQKYTKYGEDKGYDIFIKSAKILSQKYKNINFHIVGPWDETILDITGINNIVFYGLKNQEWFNEFYKNIDIIISPNINNKIGTGWFDGFPTGCVLEAMLQGVVAICTDPLRLNGTNFEKDKEMIIVEHDSYEVVEKVEYLMLNFHEIKNISIAGYHKANKLFSFEKQILPRLELLKNEIIESRYSKNYAEVEYLWELYSKNSSKLKYDQEEGNIENIINEKDISRKMKNVLKEKLPYPIVRFLKKIHHVWLGMKQI